MPAKRHVFTVTIDFPAQERAEVRYAGSSEKQASWALYRAASHAYAQKIEATVLMKRDGELVLRVRVLETDPGANRS